jgi:hypothetical protein
VLLVDDHFFFRRDSVRTDTRRNDVSSSSTHEFLDDESNSTNVENEIVKTQRSTIKLKIKWSLLIIKASNFVQSIKSIIQQREKKNRRVRDVSNSIFDNNRSRTQRSSTTRVDESTKRKKRNLNRQFSDIHSRVSFFISTIEMSYIQRFEWESSLMLTRKILIDNSKRVLRKSYQSFMCERNSSDAININRRLLTKILCE